MKRFLNIIIAAAIAVSMLAGCSFNLGSKDDNYEINTADLFADNGLTEDNEITASRANDLFEEALTASIKNQNLTIGMDFSSTYGDQENLKNNVILKYDYADIDKASVNIVSEYSSDASVAETGTMETTGSDPINEKDEISQYFVDGVLYTDNAGKKTKTEQSFANFMINNDGYSMSIYNDIISKVACIEKDDETVYFLQYDPVGYEKQVITDAEAGGSELGQDQSMTVNYANLIFTVDKNNMMTSYRYVSDITHNDNGEENDYRYDISVSFYDFGETVIDEPKDLSEYVEDTSSNE